MSKIQQFLQQIDPTANLTDEDIENTVALLRIYAPTVRRTAARIEEMGDECYERRRQSLSDFIALAIDYEEAPPMFRASDTHYAATWLLDERAPKITPPVGGAR